MDQEKPIDFIKRRFVTDDNIIRFDEQFEGYLTTLLDKIPCTKNKNSSEFYSCKIECPGCKESRDNKESISSYSGCAGCKGSGFITTFRKI